MLAVRNAPVRGRCLVVPARVKALALVLREEFGTPFRFYEGWTGEPLSDQDAGAAPRSPLRELPAEILAIAVQGRPHVSLASRDRYRLVLPIQETGGPTLVATGDLPALARSTPDSRLEQARLQKWLQSVHTRLSAPGGSGRQYRMDPPHLDQLRTVLGASKELNDLLGGLGVPGESSTYPHRIVQRAAALLPVETLIWVPPQGEETPVIEGDHRLAPDDCRELARWLSKNPERDASGCLILNQVPSSGLEARFPRIINVMALSTDGKDAGGWLIAVNKNDAPAAPPSAPGRDEHATRVEWPVGAGDPVGTDRLGVVPFRRIDAALLMPFASLLGLQSRTARHQSQVQELFAGLIRSLTAAIDAKDSYTSGHSERVARVAVELGRELGLPELELGDIYLGGLLHDIGKIGIPDSLLAKSGPLTTEEFEQIRQHVLIGCRILDDFRAMSHLLPLVRFHHERYDGMGYPHGLKGEAIPLLARVLAVADCYDAMSTTRPYRAALVRDQIEESLAQGRNRQWDGEVVDAFFRARERIYSIHQRGVGDSVWVALNAPRENGLQRGQAAD